MTQTDKRCGTCKWHDTDKCRDKAGRLHKDWHGECSFEVVYPSSVSPHNRDRSSRYMRPISGTDCPCWTPKENA